MDLQTTAGLHHVYRHKHGDRYRYPHGVTRFDPASEALLDIVKCVIHATISVTTDCHHFGRVTAGGMMGAAWAIWCFRQIIQSAHLA